jgi:predicted metalloprotease
MRWTPKGRSQDLEDIRGEAGARPGMRVMPKLSIGGILILLLLSLLFKKNLFLMLGQSADVGQTAPPIGAPGSSTGSGADEELVQFVSFVLDDAQDMWAGSFQSSGQTYQRAKLVLFTDAVSSGCGFAEAVMGPFYCPGDNKVYVDLGFYRELKNRFGAPGDFAQAYVLAHELGHHVQNQLGIDSEVIRLQRRNPSRANELSVRMELQADCLAGVWAHSTGRRDLLDPDDLDEGLNAAAAVGDDRIQRSSGVGVRPETWTHGSSEQRVRWFRTGFSNGEMRQCDTFSASKL